MISAIYYENENGKIPQYPPVDSWKPESPEDEIFKTSKRVLLVPISQYYGLEPGDLDVFIIGTKRSYNGDIMRTHLPKYMNYFEKYFDTDKEMYINYCKFKYLIDFSAKGEYTKDIFIRDIKTFLLCPSLLNKFHAMNEFNYKLMDAKKYINEKNPSLVYTDDHAKALMWISLIFNMLIPLLTHFAYVNKINNINEFLLEVFSIVIKLPVGMDIHNKLYETSTSTVTKQARSNSGIWALQDIRSINNTTHSISSLENVILNIIPKYEYDRKCVLFNYTSIRRNTYYQVLGIDYEYTYIPLNNAKRDEDNNSEFD